MGATEINSLFTKKPRKNNPYKYDQESQQWFKICSRCKIPKSLNNYHKLHGKAVISHCKVCQKDIDKKKLAKLTEEEKKAFFAKRNNTDKAREYQKKWSSELPLEKKRRKYLQGYGGLSSEERTIRRKNLSPERKAQNHRYQLEFLRKNPEKRKQYIKNSKLALEKKIAKMSEKQKEKFLEKKRQDAQRWRMARFARTKGCQIVVPFTRADIVKRDGLKCYLCKKLLTVNEVVMEHIIPISRGGNHKPENIGVSCQNCNQTKYNKTLTEYKKWRGDYERFKNSAISSKVNL